MDKIPTQSESYLATEEVQMSDSHANPAINDLCAEPNSVGTQVDVIPMRTRLQNNILRPRQFTDGIIPYLTNRRAFISITEPMSYTDASSFQSGSKRWMLNLRH